MSLNATLLGQMITFAIFVWFTMRYVWPLIIKAMHEREKTIANGLAAAEKGVLELEVAQHKKAQLLKEAKLEAAEVIEKANQRANTIVEDAKAQARVEGKRLLDMAEADIQQEKEQARFELQKHVATIAMSVVTKFLGSELDVQKQRASIEAFTNRLKDEV